MPNPFVKLWKYLTASANAQIDQRADPKIQIAQAIEAEQQRHQSLANQAAAVLGNQRQLEMRLNRQLGEVEKMQASARQALVLADKTRAGGDAAKAAEYENAAQAFATQLVAAEQSMEDLKRSHDEALQAAEQARGAVEQSRMRLQTTLAERTKLMSQLEQAKMQEHVASSLKQVNELSAPGNTPSLSEVRDKIEARYANALGQAELAADLGRGPDARGARRPPSTWPAPRGWTRSAPRWVAGPRPSRAARPAAAIEQGAPVGRAAGHRAAGDAAGRAARASRPDRSGRLARLAAVSPEAAATTGTGQPGVARGRGRPGSPVRASGSTGESVGLAARAPVGHPLLQVRALVAQEDRGAAAPARLALAAVDPVVLAAAEVAGGALLGAVAVGQHQGPRAGDERPRASRPRRPLAPRGAPRRGRATRPCRGCRARRGCAGRGSPRRPARPARLRSRRSASSRSQSGPRTSGPRWPTRRSSSAVGTISTSCSR